MLVLFAHKRKNKRNYHTKLTGVNFKTKSPRYALHLIVEITLKIVC